MFNRLLDHLEETLIAAFMGAATLLTFVAVVLRYGTGAGISWAQELTIYLFIWMAKFGAAYGVRTGIHVGVDVLVRKLTPRRQRAVAAFALGVGVFFTAVVALLGTKFVIFSYRSARPRRTWSGRWDYLPRGAARPSLMCYRFMQVLGRFLRGQPLPGHHYGEAGDARVTGVDHLRAAVRPAAHRHADLDRPWHDRAAVPVHDVEPAVRDHHPETVHQP